MNVIVDIGNTRVKVATFGTNSMLEVNYFEHNNWTDFVKGLGSHKLIISNVGQDDISVVKEFPDALYLHNQLNFN